MKRTLSALLLALSLAAPALADEGMWTFDHFPAAKVGAAYGFTPDRAFLDHIRSSSVRIAGGCSASFVSPTGLVMTNHHCAVECVGQLSNKDRDFVATGYYAKQQTDEVACPNFELDALTSIKDVTNAVLAATRGKTGTAYNDALKAETARQQATCGTNPAIRCDLVSLYHGGVYDLYAYHRYNDVRLVFAPEYGVAQFGGDPDNFNFPRFDYDISLVRAYEGGKPAATPEYLRWSKNGSRDGDVVFVSGNPGGTSRELTVAQDAYRRDFSYPRIISNLAEYRGVLEEFGTTGIEPRRQTHETLFSTENSYKELTGEEQALQDPAFFARLVARENALRAAVAKRPALRQAYGGAWETIARVQRLRAERAIAYNQIGDGQAFQSDLFGYAQTLVRVPIEKVKPSGQRLPEYSDASLARLPDELFSAAPVYPQVEELNLRFSLTKMREYLGADDPIVRAVLGKKSPETLAHELIAGTKLADVATRKALFEGGAAAIAASQDPMIRFAASVDMQSRSVRKHFEDEVLAPERKASEAIAKARFAIEGTSTYPDATFTPRLSYGTVRGYRDERGRTIAPYTTVGGLFTRASGAEPFVLPQSWLDAQSQLDPSTAMNLASTNDIIGGNSGSPLINKSGEIVGLVFDGNIESLGGNFGFDPKLNRTVSVDSRVLLAALRAVYHADRIVSEISPAK